MLTNLAPTFEVSLPLYPEQLPSIFDSNNILQGSSRNQSLTRMTPFLSLSSFNIASQHYDKTTVIFSEAFLCNMSYSFNFYYCCLRLGIHHDLLPKQLQKYPSQFPSSFLQALVSYNFGLVLSFCSSENRGWTIGCLQGGLQAPRYCNLVLFLSGFHPPFPAAWTFNIPTVQAS